MPYSPPTGNAVDFILAGGYVAPAGDAVNFELGDVLFEVVGGVDCDYSITGGVCAWVGLDYGIAVDYVLGVGLLNYGIAQDWALNGVDCDWHSFLQAACMITLPQTSDIAGSCTLAWGQAWDIARSVELRLDIFADVVQGVEAVYSVSGAEIVRAIETLYHLETATPVVAAVELIGLDASLPGYDDSVTPPAASVVDEDGTAYPLASITALRLSRRRDQFAVTGSLDFSESADYLACALGRTVTISLAGKNIVLRVYDRSRSRQHGDWRYSVQLASPAYWLDAPHAELVDGEFSGMASAVAAQLAGAVSVDWQAVDWHMPASTLIAAGQSPLELIRALAAAPGGILQSAYEGGLIVRPEYPLPVTEWRTATPALSIVEAEVGIAVEDREEYRSGVNAVLVSNTTPEGLESGGLRMESEMGDDGSITWRVYSEPWDPSVTLRHTGGDWVQLQLLGDEIHTETETVALVDGEGHVNYPVLDVVSSAWRQASLGALTVGSDGTVTSATPGESLVEITYRTRCRAWLAIDPIDEAVQFVAESAGSTGVATGAVAVLCRRGAGDRRADDIVDTLVATEEVARERGRNHIDRNCSRRQVVPITCPLTTLAEMGILVEVLDVERPAWRGVLIAQDVSWQAADDGSQDVTTTYEIEREAA